MSHRRFPLYFTTDIFPQKLGTPFQKTFLAPDSPSTLAKRIRDRFCPRFLKKVSETAKQSLCIAPNCPFYFSTDKMMLGVTVLSQRGQKRSACHYDKRFDFASIIRTNPLYPFDRIQFSASADRHRLPRPAAAKAGRTPDRVRPAAARSRRDSAAWHPLLCG